jgi:hypothetical protein
MNSLPELLLEISIAAKAAQNLDFHLSQADENQEAAKAVIQVRRDELADSLHQASELLYAIASEYEVEIA